MTSSIKKRWLWIVVTFIVALAALIGWKMTSANDNSNEPKAIYVFSGSCSYCESFGPTFEKVVKDYPDLQVEILDIKNSSDLSKATELGAEVTPTVFLVKDGKVIDKVEGDVSEKAFRKYLDKNIKPQDLKAESNYTSRIDS